MHCHDVIGFTFEARRHCLACTEDRFGPTIRDAEQPPEDDDGNPIQPIFAGEEEFQFLDNLTCDTCGESLC